MSQPPQPEITSILGTDCGSTSTKAILIEKVNGEYRLIIRGESPTTVERPYDDVTIGVRNAIREVEELGGRTLLNDTGVITPRQPDGSGVDLYLATSSAGGGLQMMVAGVIKMMSADSAERAALGAGAMIMDTIAIDDGRSHYEKVMRLRALRPDLILLSGGVDGGTTKHVAGLADLLAVAEPRPRLETMERMPLIYAGNVEMRPYVEDNLGVKMDLLIVDNIRPTLEQENLGPAREEIHRVSMEHVRTQAPGYSKLITWTPVQVMPTPAAVGRCMQTVAERQQMQVVGVDCGGASTDIYSVLGQDPPVFHRTVSANLGMSFSIAEVMQRASPANILRWLPFHLDEQDLRNRIMNKMLRPTTHAMMLLEATMEHAVAREALRIAFGHHKMLVTGLRGVQIQREMGDVFEQTGSQASILRMTEIGMYVGSGGVLSHAPRRVQAAWMLLDGFQPEGLCQLAVDSVFMMPQLGLLSTLHGAAAMEVFDKDCLIKLGTAISPVGKARDGDPCMHLTLYVDGRVLVTEALQAGTVKRFALPPGATAEALLEPARGFDLGEGKGVKLETTVHGGVVGVIADCRGRPLELPADARKRSTKLMEWLTALDAYPVDAVQALLNERRPR